MLCQQYLVLSRIYVLLSEYYTCPYIFYPNSIRSFFISNERKIRHINKAAKQPDGFMNRAFGNILLCALIIFLKHSS